MAAFHITNVAFPQRRVDLPGSLDHQYVVGYTPNVGGNQQWTFLDPLNSTRIRAVNPQVIIGANNNPGNPDVAKIIFGSGPNNRFTITLLGIAAGGGAIHNLRVRISVDNLFWTLENNDLSEQVKLRPLRGEGSTQAEINQQEWIIAAVPA